MSYLGDLGIAQQRQAEAERDQAQEDASQLAAILIDLLDRGVVSGHKERDRIGTHAALRRSWVRRRVSEDREAR